MPTHDTGGIRLRALLISRKGAWGLSLLLGWVTLVAVVGLLAVSGWFITASATAGLLMAGAYQFDFFRPAALIRLAAMTRTAGRYAERLSSHNAVLALLQDLRCHIFARLAQTENPGELSFAQQQHRLVADIDLLDQFPLSVVAPWFWASSLLVVLLVFFHWLAPMLFWAALPGLLVAWLALPALTGQAVAGLARQDTERAEARRVFLLQSLQLRAQLVIWQQWQQRQQTFVQMDEHYLKHQERQQCHSSRLLLWQHWALAASLLAMLMVALPIVQQQQLTLPWLVAALLAYLGFYEIVAPLTASFIALGLSQAARDRLNQLGGSSQNAVMALNIQNQPVCLQLQQLKVAHAGERTVDLELHGGDILVITGPSGVGKTSLLETIAGYLPPQQGRCLLCGHAYTAASVRTYLGYLPQQFDLFNLTLAQNLRLGARTASNAQLWQVLAQVGLDEWARTQPLQLDSPLGEYAVAVSGGQARRIALARLLLQPRPIMLLDEPLAGLDATTAVYVLEQLRQHQQQGILIIVSHDVPYALLQQPQVKRLEF